MMRKKDTFIIPRYAHILQKRIDLMYIPEVCISRSNDCKTTNRNSNRSDDTTRVELFPINGQSNALRFEAQQRKQS